MTVMFGRFFGVPQEVIRMRIWAKMKPGEKDLYIYLLEKSERHRTREVRCTDAEISDAVGTKGRTLCNARKKLSERRLIQYRRGNGNKFTYTLCDPTTGAPYPGEPRQPFRFHKQNENPQTVNVEQPVPVASSEGRQPESPAPEVRGIPAEKIFK